MGRLIPPCSGSYIKDHLTRAAKNLPSQIRKPKFKPNFQPEQLKPTVSGDPFRPKMQQQSGEKEARVPLSEVVADCARRWFQDTLKEARSGDSGMQILVGQMYYNGYGVPPNVQKGRSWIAKAAKSRASALKVENKRPGYNASDSDSDEKKG